MKKIVMVVILGLLTNLIPFGPAMVRKKFRIRIRNTLKRSKRQYRMQDQHSIER
jgi:hypothetical protein